MRDLQTEIMARLKMSPTKSLRIASLTKNLKITVDQLTAAVTLMPDVTRFHSADNSYGYRIRQVVTTKGVATAREAVPMHQLPPYTGETRRAGAVL